MFGKSFSENVSYIKEKSGGACSAVSKASFATAQLVSSSVLSVSKVIEKEKIKGVVDYCMQIPSQPGFRNSLNNAVQYFPTQAVMSTVKDKSKQYFLSNIDKNTSFWHCLAGNLALGATTSITSICLTGLLSMARSQLAVESATAETDTESNSQIKNHPKNSPYVLLLRVNQLSFLQKYRFTLQTKLEVLPDKLTKFVENNR